MENSSKTLFSFVLLILVLLGQMGLQVGAQSRLTKLFVFGDSYVDVGNTGKNGTGAWKQPYGITNPGYPDGRFSDGRVFSDFIAKYLGLEEPPVAYELRKESPSKWKYGMNFAVGGTGVFEFSSPPNMTTQIDHLEQLIKDKVYTASDLNNSLAYVSVAGNDYNHFLQNTTGPLPEELQALHDFIASVVNQTTNNLIRIHKLGVKKVAVGLIQPLGCLPFIRSIVPLPIPLPFPSCRQIINDIFILLHNAPLKENVARLNLQAKSNDTFLTVDLFDSFDFVIHHPKSYNITEAFTPCCTGVNEKYFCGSVEKGEKKYKVCDNPGSSFFWDPFHPTQAGWSAVYKRLQAKDALRPLRGD